MPLNEQDIALIEAKTELMAERVIEKVTIKLLLQHIESCPHGKALLKSKYLVVGSIIGAGIGGGLGGGGIVAVLIKVFGI